MRIQHKPGDAIQVDWAGDTIPVYDSVTGERSNAYLFVAVLPCSYYTYAEACDDMKTENWLNCHVHAFNYFGGVARCSGKLAENIRHGGGKSPCRWQKKSVQVAESFRFMHLQKSVKKVSTFNIQSAC